MTTDPTPTELIDRTSMTAVCRAHGIEPLRGRIPAPWRDTKDYNVSIDDRKKAYCDHVDGDRGGGMLDFISRVRGCSRQDALRWLADFVGVTLAGKPMSAPQREAWRKEKQEAEIVQAEAEHFAVAGRMMAEDCLERMASNDPERAMMTAFLHDLRISPESEYRALLKRNPKWAKALVNAGRRHDARVQVMVANYIVERMVN